MANARPEAGPAQERVPASHFERANQDAATAADGVWEFAWPEGRTERYRLTFEPGGAVRVAVEDGTPLPAASGDAWHDAEVAFSGAPIVILAQQGPARGRFALHATSRSAMEGTESVRINFAWRAVAVIARLVSPTTKLP
jgi:hypothetical protein